MQEYSAKLNWMFADYALKNTMLKEVMRKSGKVFSLEENSYYLQDKYARSVELISRGLTFNRPSYYYPSIQDDSEVESRLMYYLPVEYPNRGF